MRFDETLYRALGDYPTRLGWALDEWRLGDIVQIGGDVRIVEERFPVKSRLHKGWKGLAFNTFFVGTFNALPRALVKRYGWHLLAFCRK